MGKILLFYKYIDIANPEAIMHWQQELCNSLQLKGRIILAHEGINGTVGGEENAIEAYKEAMHKNHLFADIDFKESDGGSEFFPRMRIVVKSEIVHLGLDPQKISASDSGIHVTPAQAHTMIAEKSENLVLLDGRNYYEARIGTFTGSITPPIQHFRDLPSYIDENVDLFKDKDVLMFCTGGIRCERASAYLKSKGVTKEVFQIQGGIDRYVAEFPEGFFRGKNYVFDGRVAVKVNEDILGTCDICGIPFDDYTNCLNAECNKQFLGCPTCIQKFNNTCSQTCCDLVENQCVVVRTISKKIQPKNSPNAI